MDNKYTQAGIQDSTFGDNNTVEITQTINYRDKKDDKFREVFLERLYSFWIESVLYHPLWKTLWKHKIELEFSQYLDLEDEKVVKELTFNYEESHEQFMISNLHTSKSSLLLGDAGSGKTIAILEITQNLIQQARQDVTKPIPITLNLASWKGEKIIDWIAVEVFSLLQHFPKKITYDWIEKQNIFLFLDGLDEVEITIRNNCVKAINEFHNKYGAIGIFIGIRLSAYNKISEKLYIENLVYIKSLTSKQINDYLVKWGESLDGLREALLYDEVLQKIAKTPLMLTIMSLAYENILASDLPKLSKELQEKDIWKRYVNRMFIHRYLDQRNRANKIEKWKRQKESSIKYLISLSNKMIKSNQSILLIERISDKWFHHNYSKWQYRFSLVIIGGLIGGLASGIFPWLSGFNEIVNNSQILQKTVGKRNLIADAFSGIIIGGVGGLASSLEDLILVELSLIDFINWSRYKLLMGIFIIASMIITSGIIIYIFKAFWATIIICVVVTIFQEVFSNVFRDINFPDGKSAEDRRRPNEGIHQSLMNSIITLLVLMLVTLIFAFLGGYILDLLVVNKNIKEFYSSSILTVGGYITIAVSLYNGGLVFIQHWIIRLILTYGENSTPLNYAKFLDQSSDRLFLQKVGGGYIFVHGLLMEYFNQLELEE